MAQHEVILHSPPKKITKADHEFEIKSNGTLLGRLQISKGAIVWYDKGSKKGNKASWESLRRFMLKKPEREKR